MLDLFKKHGLCLLIGMGLGCSLLFCPMFNNLVGVNDNKACQCETCCDPCDCVEACVDGSCPCCPEVAGPCLRAPEGRG